MTSLQNAASFFLLLHGSVGYVQSKEFEGVASDGNFILEEQYSSDMIYYGPVTVNSNVPVTIHRYYDDEFLEGSQPVQCNEAKVLVTSDCAATTFVPQVTMGPNSIDVTVHGAPGDMSFLESSSYGAEWSYESYWCRHFQSYTYPPTSTPPPIEGGRTFSLKSILPSSMRNLLENSMWTKAGETEEETPKVLSSNVCNVNVEVLIDGCSHEIDVTAPTVRVLDANLENFEASTSDEDECITNYSADIVFPGPPSLEGDMSLSVPSIDCYRPVPGRPFVDSTGSVLQASPLIASSVVGGVKAAWSANEGARLPESSPSSDNSTIIVGHQNRLLLGEEWTRNALGEHASVASFAAFSIALMTNGAPSDLVRDALVAAMDEVRHAETSFDIASKLAGREIGPGQLPRSEHAFRRDVTALALAVAREGCIDETLSALEVAAEVDLIDAVLNDDGGAMEAEVVGARKYSGIDAPTLAWIRDELRTIALEESDHAALAWRTVRWACNVEPDACDAIGGQVLNEDELEGAFRRRFVGASSEGRWPDKSLEIMMTSWRSIYHSRDSPDALPVCANDDVVYDAGVDGDESLVSAVAGNVVRGLCS